jgi:rare lipoprotein A
MVRAGIRGSARLALIMGTALTLAGCQMTGDSGIEPATMAATQPPGPGQRAIERDVEAPDVFQVAEAGLWDGRPSLGGVWVAHPSATDPERVLIRNAATGTEVIGALFRRERENPGPRFQISSEAANALNILPGAPTDLEVTALRLQRIEMEIDPAPAEDAPAATAADETLAIAPVDTPEAGTTGQPAGAPQAQVEIVDEEPRRRGFLGLFTRREREPEPAGEIAQTTLEPATGPSGDDAAMTGVAGAQAAATGTAETAEPRAERRGLLDLFRRREPEPEADTTLIALPGGDTPAQAAPVQPQPQASSLDRPFVQIGIFSVEQNAINSRNRMQAAGMSADIRRGRVGDNLFWRVVVGPAMSTGERTQILRQVREMGFADAYAVVR